jgi:hypothetical protein
MSSLGSDEGIELSEALFDSSQFVWGGWLHKLTNLSGTPSDLRFTNHRLIAGLNLENPFLSPA